MIAFALFVYILIGVFFMGMLPDSAGRPFIGMVFMWIVFVPILAIGKIFDIIFRAGLKIGKWFKRAR